VSAYFFCEIACSIDRQDILYESSANSQLLAALGGWVGGGASAGGRAVQTYQVCAACPSSDTSSVLPIVDCQFGQSTEFRNTRGAGAKRIPFTGRGHVLSAFTVPTMYLPW
jgi:hypothetical protein